MKKYTSQKIKIYKVNQLFKAIPKDEKAYPFDISLQLIDMNKDEVKGPGIYMIGYKKELIYVGKFESKNRGDVRSDRIRRHLEGLTLRGTQCGFNSDCSKMVLKDKLLNGALRKSSCYVKRIKECKRTGAMTSVNKVQFASNHIKEFMTKDHEAVFRHFSIGYFQLKKNNNINKIEKEIISIHNPICNSEYVEGNKTSAFEKAITSLLGISK